MDSSTAARSLERRCWRTPSSERGSLSPSGLRAAARRFYGRPPVLRECQATCGPIRRLGRASTLGLLLVKHMPRPRQGHAKSRPSLGQDEANAKPALGRHQADTKRAQHDANTRPMAFAKTTLRHAPQCDYRSAAPGDPNQAWSFRANCLQNSRRCWSLPANVARTCDRTQAIFLCRIRANLGRSGGQCWSTPKSGQLQPNSGRSWSTLGRVRWIPGKQWPNLNDIGEHRPTFGRLRAKVADIGRCCPRFGRIGFRFNRFRTVAA